MRFPFPAAEATESDATPKAEPSLQEIKVEEAVEDVQLSALPDAVAVEPVAEAAAIVREEFDTQVVPTLEPEPEAVPRPASVPRPRSKPKVIAFPRQASEAPAVHRLADPVVSEQPRILDVPEELEAFPGTPLLDGLQFAVNSQQAPAAPADHIELPFHAVTIPQRLYAGLVDCVLVAAATAVFGAVGYKMLPKLVFTKPMVPIAAAVPILLWAIYQYLLTVYAGATAGMRVAKICLSTFKGTSPNRRHRRSRVIGLYFSTASLLMGLLWALVDVDLLCWHDRISRTYLTSRDQPHHMAAAD